VPLSAVRVLDEPMTIGRYEVPAGLHIGIDVYACTATRRATRTRGVRPERFVDGAPSSYAFLPFAAGAPLPGRAARRARDPHRARDDPAARRLRAGDAVARGDGAAGRAAAADGGGRIRVRGVRTRAAQAPGLATMSATTSTRIASSMRE
jgi:hypothetical protein